MIREKTKHLGLRYDLPTPLDACISQILAECVEFTHHFNTFAVVRNKERTWCSEPTYVVGGNCYNRIPIEICLMPHQNLGALATVII